MWNPSHIQVTVLRATNLVTKGKNGTNDAYVTIDLGKEKFKSAVKEKAVNPEWNEECDLAASDGQLPLTITAFHRNLLGTDDFLGQATISLDQFKPNDKPRSGWYPLKNKKSSKKPEKYRGEVEVKICYVKPSFAGSVQSLNKLGKSKNRLSIKSFGNIIKGKQSDKYDMHADEFGRQTEYATKYKPEEMLATAYKPAVSAADDMNKSFDLEHDEDDDSDRRSIGSSKGENDSPSKGHRNRRLAGTRGFARSAYDINIETPAKETQKKEVPQSAEPQEEKSIDDYFAEVTSLNERSPDFTRARVQPQYQSLPARKPGELSLAAAAVPVIGTPSARSRSHLSTSLRREDSGVATTEENRSPSLSLSQNSLNESTISDKGLTPVIENNEESALFKSEPSDSTTVADKYKPTNFKATAQLYDNREDVWSHIVEKSDFPAPAADSPRKRVAPSPPKTVVDSKPEVKQSDHASTAGSEDVYATVNKASSARNNGHRSHADAVNNSNKAPDKPWRDRTDNHDGSLAHVRDESEHIDKASTPVLNSQWHQEERTSSLSAISPIKMNTSRTPMQNGTITDSTVSASQSQKQLDMALIASQSGRDDTMTVPQTKTNSSAAPAANSDNREELLKIIATQKAQLEKKDATIRDLENYIDDLLVKIMDTADGANILQKGAKAAAGAQSGTKMTPVPKEPAPGGVRWSSSVGHSRAAGSVMAKGDW